MELVLLYVPVPDGNTGRAIARTLIQEKLVACGNLLPPQTSFFEWQGKISEEVEHTLILKTTSSKAVQAQTRVEALHPYDVPCVLTVRAENANVLFSDWVHRQTQG